MATFKEMFDHAEDFRAATAREKCRSTDDLILLAAQLTFQARVIYEHLGGKQQAAAQFYAVADDIATDKTPPLTMGGEG